MEKVSQERIFGCIFLGAHIVQMVPKYIWMRHCIFVGNKAKGRISKRMFQESKARQYFWKVLSYPLL